MAIGDVSPVTAGDTRDVYSLDVGLFDLPEFGAVYIIDDDRPAIVDTGLGTNVELILDGLAEVGIDRDDLEAVLVTHVHLDHAGGAGFLADACPRADVYVHEIGAPHLVDPERLVAGTKRTVGDRWTYYTLPEPVPEDRVVELTDGDVVDLGDRTLDVHHAPGHAPHQVVLQDERDGIVFSADAAGNLFPAIGSIVVPTPPPNFDLDLWLEDVDLLRSLDPAAILYAHFGPHGRPRERLDELEETLVDWVEEIETAWRELGDEAAVVRRMTEESVYTGVWPDELARGEVRMNVRGVLLSLEREDRIERK